MTTFIRLVMFLAQKGLLMLKDVLVSRLCRGGHHLGRLDLLRIDLQGLAALLKVSIDVQVETEVETS